MENYVQTFPQSPPSPAAYAHAQKVTPINSHITHIVHSLKSHIVHSQDAQNNRGSLGLIPHFHTTYYYYY
jgi:hypothetical protein